MNRILSWPRGSFHRPQYLFGSSKYTSPCLRVFPSRSESSIANAFNDDRARLSKFWIPTGGITASADEDSHAKLVRAGFLRQAHSGIFHMLPLGRRVQSKLEALIDKHMSTLGASRLDLSSISSEELWERSGRLASSSELFRFEDRKHAEYLLAPTHEEEITELVSKTVKSYKELPVRLYQIGRKYRDELRPRHGLLRSREFLMKDLYTFDYSSSLALATYEDVRKAYKNIFDELKIPYLVANADSGDMGGDLSHEFHFPTAKGEDNVINCTSCDYVANEELAQSGIPDAPEFDDSIPFDEQGQVYTHHGISLDKKTFIRIWYWSPSRNPIEVAPHSIKGVIPEYDSSIEDAQTLWYGLNDETKEQASSTDTTSRSNVSRIINLFDGQFPQILKKKIMAGDPSIDQLFPTVRTYDQLPSEFLDLQNLQLQRIKNGDICPQCNGKTLKVQKAIELGHTFHLGTRYSEPMQAVITIPSELVTDNKLINSNNTSGASVQIPMEMGCHGIGVTRMIGAVAETLADEKGLNWPRVMAPYEIVVVANKANGRGSEEVYDLFSTHPNLDVILDDRLESFAWKMGDADLVGYPIIVIVGKGWKDRMCEVQCRRLNIKQNVAFDELRMFVEGLLNQL